MSDVIIHCKYDELVDPKTLKDHPKNRNKHGEDQIERLSKLYTFHGIRHPIILSRRSGCMVAGHGRRAAAIKAGIEKFPVVYQDFESEDAEYAFIQADNAIALWADLDLAGINSDVIDLGPEFDIDMLGIKDFTLEPAEKFEAQADDDSVPENAETRCKPGDIWQLGRHRLMCGDSTSLDAVEKLMAGEKADLCFTSPPYNIGSIDLRSNNNLKKIYANDADQKSDEEYEQFLNDFFALANRFSEVQAINLQLLSKGKVAILNWLSKWKNHVIDIYVWTKRNAAPAMAKNVPSTAHELIFVFDTNEFPNRAVRTGPNNQFSTVYTSNIAVKEEIQKSHGAVYPVEFAEHFITNMTQSKMSVYDPFSGTGTTAIACEKTNRKCFMMELDPHYCDVILARWEKYTGKQAERV